MKTYYSAEKNVLILISLLKAHGIKKIIASPGTTNVCFVASVQQDQYFDVYSCVDERSAAYMACGMAAESNETVVLSCTGATASRNYLPGLTEAFYRKLPVLAITSTRSLGKIGQNIDQVIDRTQQLNDIAKKSIQLPIPRTEEEEWECNVKINDALIALRRQGGGPVHINLVTEYSLDFSITNLPEVRSISYHTYGDELPSIPDGNIGIFVGAHLKWSDKLTQKVDSFCEKYNAVVLVDQISNYKGKYGVFFNIITQQKMSHPVYTELELLIHIGDISASSYTRAKKVWRVCRDGAVRDTFKKLSDVFEMNEEHFFETYLEQEAVRKVGGTHLFSTFKESYDMHLKKINESVDNIPFSNIWIALEMHDKLPLNSVLHLGILNSLRSWNMFKTDNSILAYSNTGGFGIDGGMSSLIGASLVDTNRIYFGILGDLAFFYDMNSLGNRHIGNNVRILVVNNGIGSEFKNNMNLAMRAGIGDNADFFIAAHGHYGNKSADLVRHYAKDLGFDYYSANDKSEFLGVLPKFLNDSLAEKPIIIEAFTNSEDDINAIDMIQTIGKSSVGMIKSMAKDILGDEGYKKIVKMIRT